MKFLLKELSKKDITIIEVVSHTKCIDTELGTDPVLK